MDKKRPAPVIEGTLRKKMLHVPEVIRECSGIIIFGKRIKSLVFSTDLSIIRNVNADAVMAVYAFTPQPVIIDALLMAADIPVFAGVGGGLTRGERAVSLALEAEHQGAMAVVLNAPTANDTIVTIKEKIDIPIVVSVVADFDDIDARVEAGTTIFNVSAAADTPRIVRKIREKYPDFPIIATGGPTDETIRETIQAGANAITWTPPSNAEIFKGTMEKYRSAPH